MKQSGFWWRTMGFTRTHVIGVFVTESLLCVLAILLMAAAVIAPSTSLLLAAICLLLLAIATLLASILSLLFFRWWSADEPDVSSTT